MNTKIDLCKNNYIIVPRAVTHESEEYLVTSIIWIGGDYLHFLNIGGIYFAYASSVTTISHNSFTNSSIEEIYFPKSLKELKEGWCNNTYDLKIIKTPPYNNQLSDEDCYKFDILLFASRDIETIFIPDEIKIISSYAFHYCKKLVKIDFSVGRDAFAYSSINYIFLPRNLKELKEGWCSGTKELNSIIVSQSNEHFTKGKDHCLVGESENDCEENDILLFVRSDTSNFSIPESIKIISSYALSQSKIKEVFIPTNVSKICEHAFSKCSNLIKVEFPTNSNLRTIDSYAFSNSNIKEICIPTNFSRINECAFFSCSNLQIVEILEDSKLQSITSELFTYDEKVIIMIPPSLRINFK